MHSSACRAVGMSFTPLAFEALGGMSELTASTLSKGLGQLGQRLGVSPTDSTRHFFSGVRSLYGEGMPPSGFTGSLPSLPPITCHLTSICSLVPLFKICF